MMSDSSHTDVPSVWLFLVVDICSTIFKTFTLLSIPLWRP